MKISNVNESIALVTPTATSHTCSTCPAIIHQDALDPHYEGLLATYSDQHYCTLICMQHPMPDQQNLSDLS